MTEPKAQDLKSTIPAIGTVDARPLANVVYWLCDLQRVGLLWVIDHTELMLGRQMSIQQVQIARERWSKARQVCRAHRAEIERARTIVEGRAGRIHPSEMARVLHEIQNPEPAAQSPQEDERVVPLANGYRICSPGYPASCDHVRLVSPDNKEVARWEAIEWRDDPQRVMGELMGWLAHPEGRGRSRLARVPTLIRPFHHQESRSDLTGSSMEASQT